jgi:pilus assembly protein CpaE
MGVLRTEDEPTIVACAIARDVKAFDLLIEDMETELGESWGGLDFVDGLAYLSSPDAQTIDFVTVAVDRKDEDDLDPVTDLISVAKKSGIKVILVAHDLTPMALHQLLRSGADDFAPYPLPEGALHDAIERLRKTVPATHSTASPAHGAGGDRAGAVIPIYGLAGGVGATMLSVNLAWEMAQIGAAGGLRVCLLDLDIQSGSVATYLDLPRREAIYEMLSDTASMDEESFGAAMQSYNERLHVLTAPADALPLDLLHQEDIDRILDMATAHYDFVFIDMPTTLVQWTETILNRADIYFAVMELDMRCAQNALRFIRALKSEDLPHEKVRYALNRAPKFTDISGRSRIKRLAENLGIQIDLMFSDGGKQVVNSCDHGLPLSETATKNPLRKEIQKLAQSIHDLATEHVATR